MADFQAPVTPYRGTLLRLDVPTRVMIEPPFGMTRQAQEMSRSPEAQAASSNVMLLDADGWALKPLQMNVGYAHERLETASSFIPFNTPAGWVGGSGGEYTFRSPADQPGALTGASANISTQGDGFIKKRLSSSKTWDDPYFHDAADQAALPSPDVGTTIVIDRIGIGIGNHDPNDGFFVRFRIAGGKVTSADVALGDFFSGPAGVDPSFMGFGYFGCTYHGDGNLTLYERGLRLSDASEVWRERAVLRFCPSNVATTGTHRVFIRPVTYAAPKAGASGHIYIYHEGADRASAGTVKKSYGGSNSLVLASIYTSPATGDTVPRTRVGPHRIDARRAERHEIALQAAVYPNSGTLRCDAFTAEHYMSNGIVADVSDPTPIRAYVWGIVPSGCSLDIGLFFASDNSPLTPTGVSGAMTDGYGNTIGAYRFFECRYPDMIHYPEIYLTGPADLNGGAQSSKTPIAASYQIIKDGRTEDLTPTEVQTKVTRFSMIGQDADPRSESAGATVKDPGNQISLFRTRGSIPAVVQTKYDPADPTKYSILFQGWGKAKGQRRGAPRTQGLQGASASWPAADWKSYEATFMGEWMHLAIARVPFRWDFSSPLDNGAFPKVTDVIRQGFAFAGYSDEQIDVPDLPVRMYFDREAGHLDALADVGELLKHLAFDYLGSWLKFDPNCQVAGSSIDQGVWRLRPSNYDADTLTVKGPVLAHFHTNQATDTHKLAAFAAAWSMLSYPTETVDGQDIQHCYVRKGSLFTDVRAPEANIITITGTGTKLFGTGRDADNASTVTFVNPKSFNFAGLPKTDPNYPSATDNPDYLGYISTYTFPDGLIRTLEGARWVGRRVYQRLCHGGLTISFQAPLLLVTDSTDLLQIRPRPLGFYDAVKVDGIVFFVKGVSAGFVKDSQQWMVYDLELPNGVLY